MKVIDKGYAIIYIDYDGDTLDEDNFYKSEIVDGYYKEDGPIQWNHYLIYPSDVVPLDKVDEVLNNESYCRMLVIPRDQIDFYINNHFPEITDKPIVNIIKTKYHSESVEVIATTKNAVGSYMRDYDSLDVITMLDDLRRRIIRGDINDVTFVTHLTKEVSLVKKKLVFK